MKMLQPDVDESKKATNWDEIGWATGPEGDDRESGSQRDERKGEKGQARRKRQEEGQAGRHSDVIDTRSSRQTQWQEEGQKDTETEGDGCHYTYRNEGEKEGHFYGAFFYPVCPPSALTAPSRSP